MPQLSLIFVPEAPSLGCNFIVNKMPATDFKIISGGIGGLYDIGIIHGITF
jgi:hypothetical protein